MSQITFRYDRRVPGAGMDGLGELSVLAKDAFGVVGGLVQFGVGNWILSKQKRPWYVSLMGYSLYAGGVLGLASPLINFLSSDK